MGLDRQSIERKDFPVGRRGYDPEAVDAHLSMLADEIANFKRSARRRSDTLASSASDQVRAIVEAAESSAADIQRDAENEAREIRDEANSEAQATREQAAEQAREYVGKVSESTSSMLSRLDAMDAELGDLIDTLRTGSNRLSADLQLLESNLAQTGDVFVPRQAFEPEAEAEAASEPADAEPGLEAARSEAAQSQAAEPRLETAEPASAEPEGGSELGAELPLEPAQPGSVAQAVPEAEHDAAVAATAAPAVSSFAPVDATGESSAGSHSRQGGADDAEGARLIALNMALNGTPREETAHYLSENFHLTDAHRLLDEVYASVEG